MAKGDGKGWRGEKTAHLSLTPNLGQTKYLQTNMVGCCFYSKTQNFERQCVASIDCGNPPTLDLTGSLPFSFGLCSPYVIDIYLALSGFWCPHCCMASLFNCNFYSPALIIILEAYHLHLLT